MEKQIVIGQNGVFCQALDNARIIRLSSYHVPTSSLKCHTRPAPGMRASPEE